ncbi:hypothetical protein [Pseudomonas sp.]|uniref:hypothetical protein n=1 Tax=Pseudomonas sp. TaxID=306 RepID=UPI003D0AAFCD
MTTLDSAKLYGRIVLLRRQVLLRQLVRRSITAALAVEALIVTSGLATYALFLAIKGPLGDLGATLAIAALYLVAALALTGYALYEPHSPELEALAEMEAAALEAVTTDTQGIVQLATIAGHRIENLGSSLTLGVGVLGSLRKLLASRKP